MTTEIDTRTGYLDHLARVGCDLRSRCQSKGGMVFVDGASADEAGSLALIELATECGVTVAVEGASEHHRGKTFEPRASAMSAGTAATTKIGAGLQPASAAAKPGRPAPIP